MTITIGRGTFRSAALLLIGAVLGAGAIASATPVESATTYTRVASCHGFNFHPIDKTGFDHNSFMLLRTYSTGSEQGDGYFVCDPNLPHNAVVTKVSFTVEDAHPQGDVRYCSLYRKSLNPVTADTLQNLMAEVPATVGVPLTVRLTDTTIEFAKVDNANFGYHLQCQLSEVSTHAEPLGIFGAVVTYKITAANG